jgi:F-type H+-transporting ATPase subunit a
MPGSFCLTAQFIITFLLSSLIFFSALSISIFYGKGDFFLHFIPDNVPTLLKPFLAIIELLSYISRLFSLAVRLFANLVAGHSLLHILSDSNLKIGSSLGKNDIILILLLLFPASLTVAIFGLEGGIAALQAYVFAVLGLIYLREAENFV